MHREKILMRCFLQTKRKSESRSLLVALVQAVAHHHAPTWFTPDTMDPGSAVYVAQALCEEFLPVDTERWIMKRPSSR